MSNVLSTLKPIGMTVGEPAGIGPDIALSLLQRSNFSAPVILVSDAHFIADRALKLGIDINLHEITEAEIHQQGAHRAGVVPVLTCTGLNTTITPGQLSTETVAWVLETIKKTSSLCEHNILGAMVTGPVHKAIINDAGVPFSGHTDFIAECLQAANNTPLMMLTSGTKLPKPLRVALATTHHPLKAVAPLITSSLILEKIMTFHHGLQTMYGIASPRILVAGLNPHAGEQGHLGHEEEQHIRPAIKKASQQGIKVQGPFPADTLFTPTHLKDADGVLAMYHDQGLPVLKYASFGDSINVTLGLPIVRTSVDHGTALSLAGSGKASDSSLSAAIQEAITITQYQSRSK